MKDLQINKNLNEEDNLNWDIIEISKVNDKIIKSLINNLKLDLSDNFFISFESLLKLGKKAESAIESQIKEMDETHNFRKKIFKFILSYVKNNKIEKTLILQLYHPDFVVRARALMRIEKNKALNNLNFILPLINDPDDSVRWSVIKLLNSLNQIKNPVVYKKLKNRIKKESNPVIKKKLVKILKKI